MRRAVTDQQTQDVDPMLFDYTAGKDVDAGLATIRTTSRRDITRPNPPVILIQYTALMSRPRVFIHT